MKSQRLIAFVVCAAACDHPSRERPSMRVSALGDGVVAAVGETPIDARAVAVIASSAALSASQARDALVFDAVLATAMRVDDPAEADRAEVRVLARALMHRLGQEAQRAPITGTELDEFTQIRFVELDRPPGFRVVHAVVLVGANASPEELRAARLHAETIRAAVEPVVRAAASEPPPDRGPEEAFVERPDQPVDRVAERFRTAFAELDHANFDTRFESLGVIASDGRFIDLGKSPWDRVHEEFAQATARLVRRGEVSPIVETELDLQGKPIRGLHVIALLERTPEFRLSEERRLAVLEPDILLTRAQRARADLIKRLRSEHPVELARNVTALLEAVPVVAAPNAPIEVAAP